jgi:streptothricin acetyltransferase
MYRGSGKNHRLLCGQRCKDIFQINLPWISSHWIFSQSCWDLRKVFTSGEQPMPISIRALNEHTIQDVERCDGTFIVDSKLVLYAENGKIHYTIAPIAPYQKQYPQHTTDYRLYIHDPDKAIYLVYLDTDVAGRIILQTNWNRYAYIEDIAVDAKFRQQGIGRALIQQAIAWAKEKQLPGMMLETQNNNVAACLFYQRCGFELGGFDQYLYRAINPPTIALHTEEIALFWYLIF